MKKLLINFVYYRPVGHVVEAIKYAKGYFDADNNMEINLLLNADSPIELAGAFDWIKKVYPISLQNVLEKEEEADSIKNIPKEWDYIAYDERIKSFKKGWDEDDLIKTQEVLQRVLKAKIAEAPTGSNFLPYRVNAKVILPIPQKATVFVRKYKHDGIAVSIMLGGSAGSAQSPSVKMWLKICRALFEAIPNLKVYFTGVTKGMERRTLTEDYTLEDVECLINNLPNAEAAYNIGLWNQLALVQKSNIFLSPHTGFAFLAPLVGTPWLALSNCRWSEYMFNYVPFYSVLPDCGYYPALDNTTEGCGELLAKDKKALCMRDEFLEKKIPEIIEGTKLLLNSNFTYKKSIELHLKKIKEKYDLKKFSFFGGIEGINKSENKNFVL